MEKADSIQSFSRLQEGRHMQNPPAKQKRKKPLILTDRDEKILRAIYAYRYMTTLDVSWLLFKPTSKNHVGEILTALAGGKDLQTHSYLCRFGLPKVGNSECIFTLGAKGRRFLTECGLPKKGYFYPSMVQTKIRRQWRRKF
jgi:hypothetical protein